MRSSVLLFRLSSALRFESNAVLRTLSTQSGSWGADKKPASSKGLGCVLASLGALSVGFAAAAWPSHADAKALSPAKPTPAAKPQPAAATDKAPAPPAEPPTYSVEEVAKHRDAASGGIWVTYKGEVYDITEFVEAHPGGTQKIMMAAGGSIGEGWLHGLHSAGCTKLQFLTTAEVLPCTPLPCTGVVPLFILHVLSK